MANLVMAAMGSLIPKLYELLKEYGLHKGVKKRILSLTVELRAAQAALSKVAEIPWDQLDEQVQLWAREVREASYDMEDVLDTFLVRVAAERAESLLKRLTKKSTNITQIRDIMAHLQKMETLLTKMMKGLYEVEDIMARPATASTVDPRLAAMYTQVNKLVGMDNSSGELMSMLGDVSSMKMKTVSIVGVGGLGKTTLAKVVYDRMRGDFDCTAFVRVGQNPDLKKVLKDILIDLDKQRYTRYSAAVLDERQLIDELRSFLSDKRYFIVVDDIWDRMFWETIKSAIGVDNNHGSRIIITTRISDAVREVGYVYKLQPLPNDSSRKLFNAILSGDVGKYVDDQPDEICDKILRKTGGIPLAIITVASLLVGKPKDKWSEICESIGFSHRANEQGGNTTRILSMSYYDLPPDLTACFLYLSGFPENYVIKKDNLIWKWIAEGFVHDSQGIGLVKTGEKYFNELINRSMIQPVMIEGTDFLYGCRIHYSVLCFIRSLSDDEKFIHVFGQPGLGQILESGNVRRLAFLNRYEEHSWDNTYLLPKLRSLTAIECPAYMIPPVSSFNLLRVLDLESCGSLEGHVLGHIGKLYHLRFIGLRNTFVGNLPEEIGHLKFLQTLDLEGSGVEELPASMSQLSSLACLNADWTTRVPEWIGMLTSLQQLVMYPGVDNVTSLQPGGDNVEYSARWFAKGLAKLEKLRVLRFLIKAQDEEQLRVLFESLGNLQDIEVLHFDSYGVQLNRGVQLEPADFALSRNLCFLEIPRLEFSRLPEWIQPQVLPNLCHLWLMLFDVEDKDLEILGSFPMLVYVNLVIVNTERGTVATAGSDALFQKLKYCSITKPLKIRKGDMPRLEVIEFHLNLRLLTDAGHDFEFDLGLGNLTSLRQVLVQINCQAALPKEVEKAEDAIRHAIDTHPNHPILEISLFGEAMKTMGADLKIITTNLNKANKISSSDEADELRDKLIEKLSQVGTEAYNRKTKIVSIVRSEGRGKTPLAQKVFDKLSLQFEYGAFVLLGQNPDLRKVFTDILMDLDKQKYNDFPFMVLDIMELIGLVHGALISKRFFIVIDDIWDLKAWEIIKFTLIENNNGSAILTTSPNTDITTVIGGHEQLIPLETAHSRKIFYKKLFGSEDKCPPELGSVCENLIETCGGILAVIDETVTSLASIPQTVEGWQAVYDRRKFLLSYPKLPDHLKKCLLYLSMFRQGYEISAERLVWAWIAQGFVQETVGQKDLQKLGKRENESGPVRESANRLNLYGFLTNLIKLNLSVGSPTGQMVSLGKSYLSELVNRKMIEAVEVDADGMALSCRLYDLLHDLMVSKATEENSTLPVLAVLDDSQKDRALPSKVHWMSIQGKNIVHSPPKAWLHQVQSLVVSCDTVPSFSEFLGLHAMDLGCCKFLEASHLKDIKKTIPLRYLVIGGKYIAGIPKEIAKLENLWTLDLSASGLSELPKCILLLSGLKCLFVNSHMKIPDGIANMSALQELGDINIVNPQLLQKLRKLHNLRILRIAIWSWDEDSKSSVKLWWDTLLSEVGFWEKMDRLCILTFCSLDFMDGSDYKWPSQTLKTLEIKHSAFNNNKLPSWIETLSHISSLTIEVNKLSQNIIDTLGMLPTLSSLSLTSKQVPEPEVHFAIDSADSFNKLESLKFVSDEMVKLLERPESNAKQQFTRLTIVFHASRTAQSRSEDFRFGLDKLLSLQHVRVEINCSNARQKMVNDAEGAIREEISKIYRNDGSRPNLEIRRLQKEGMIAEDDQTTGLHDANTSSSSTMETMQAQPIGQSLMPGVEIVSSSNDTLKQRALQELTAEKQGSIALHQEVDDLKKKFKVTEEALAKIQREFEEYKKQQEENNLRLNRMLQSNNTGNS